MNGIRKIPIDDRKGWVEALAAVPHSFFHTWGFVNAIAAFKGERAQLYIYERERLLLAVPVLERTYRGCWDLTTPYGYSGILSRHLDSAGLDTFKRLLQMEGVVCSYLTVNPVLSETACFASEHFCRRNTCYAVDLRPSEECLVGNIRRRSQVRLKDDAELVTDKEQLVGPFVELYVSAMGRVNADPSYRFDRTCLERLCDADGSYLLGIKTAGEMVAVTLSGTTPWVADFVLSGSTPEGRRYSFPLLWRSMLLARSVGVPVYSLGGGMTEDDGLARFKAKFGGQRYRHGALKLVHDEETYRMLCEEAMSSHADKNGYFPAYRAPRTCV